MISHDDFGFISRFDSGDGAAREALIRENPAQLAKTFYSMLSQVSIFKGYLQRQIAMSLQN
jgi:hypothetical protein